MDSKINIIITIIIMGSWLNINYLDFGLDNCITCQFHKYSDSIVDFIGLKTLKIRNIYKYKQEWDHRISHIRLGQYE